MAKVRPGAWNDSGASYGPIISGKAKDRIESLIATGEAQGANLLLDGRGCTVDGLPDGNWVGPTLFSGVTTEMDIYNEEIFGPVLSCVETDTLGDAIELVNNSPYGNGVSIFTSSGGAARRFQHEIDVGQVGVNIPFLCPCRSSPSPVGRVPSTVISMPMANRRFASTPKPRRLPPAGSPVKRPAQKPTSLSSCVNCVEGGVFGPELVSGPLFPPPNAKPSIWSVTMDFNLSEDQLAFREAARAFAEKSMAPHAAKWDDEHIFPVDMMKEAGEMGFMGMYTPEALGGMGLSRLDTSVIVEELAAACPSTAAFITIHNMATWMVASFASDDLKQEIVPKLASGEWLASYCLTEPGAGSDAANLRTKAVRDGDSYVINGSKVFISGAGATDILVLMARTGAPDSGYKGISTFVIPADADGVSYGKNEENWAGIASRPG